MKEKRPERAGPLNLLNCLLVVLIVGGCSLQGFLSRIGHHDEVVAVVVELQLVEVQSHVLLAQAEESPTPTITEATFPLCSSKISLMLNNEGDWIISGTTNI